MKKFFANLRDKNNKFWARLYSPKTEFARKGKWYAIAPAVVVLIGLIMFLIPGVGFNLGLEFTGGQVIEAYGYADSGVVKSVQRDVEKYLDKEGIKYEISTPESTSTGSGEGSGLGISVKYQIKNGASGAYMDDIAKGITERVEQKDGETKIVTARETEKITASASGERLMITFISIAVTLIAILIYILFRFKFTSGVAAFIGLIHDILVAIALCVLFRVQINYSFVAAMITVVVYSLNNTIVLFDRIRSKEKQLNTMNTKMPVEQVVDSCVKETFARTMATTITTIVPVVFLCLIPVTDIRNFALPILFGLIAGTFSTLYITTALYLRFETYRLKAKKFKERKALRQENLVRAE